MIMIVSRFLCENKIKILVSLILFSCFHFFSEREREKVTNKASLYESFRNDSRGRSVLASDSRNSRPEVFCKKGVLRNFAKFTGKHQCQSLLFNKVVGLEV